MDSSAGQRSHRKNRDQIARIRDAGQVVHQVLEALQDAAVPGVSTGELDELARQRTLAFGASPAFLGYSG